jgi:pimeloyl-ACP methyl ester carboxylesterase
MHMKLINTALTHAQRVVHTLPWGDVVWHVWRASEGAQVLLDGSAKALAHEPVNSSSVVHEPLVLLHGGSGSWTHWVKNVLHLSQTRDVWALDLPGFGDSALPPDVRDADDLVPYLNALLQHAFPNRTVDVMGFSFGGMTAGLLAAAPEHNIRRLMLVGVPGLGLMQEALPMRGMMINMTRAQERDVHRHNLNAMMLHHASSVTDEVIDLQEANVARDRMRRRRIARTDVLAKAQSQWRIPVSGIWGQEDALYRGALDKVAQQLPNMSTLSIVPNAGHWVMFERPDAFHVLLDAWL